MRILVVGAGAVGVNVASQLSTEEHDISLIDKSSSAVKRAAERVDALTITGNASSPSVLESAGIKGADMMIAVTNEDEVNIFVCILAEHYGVKSKIARVRNDELTNKKCPLDFSKLGIDHIINPDKTTVNLLLDIIQTPGATDAANFAGGEILLRGFDVPEDAPLAGKKLADLQELSVLDSFRIIAILRNGAATIPRGDTYIQPGDRIFALISKNTIPLFLPMINRKADEVEKVVILGANQMGLRLASALEGRIENTTLIEPTSTLAEAAATKLSKTLVIHGQGTDVEIIKEAKVDTADFFIAISEHDETNLLASLLAKKHGAKKVVALSNQPEYVPVWDSLDLDAVVNPRLTMVGAILQHVRQGDVLSVIKLSDVEAEAIELVAMEGSQMVGKPLREIKFPKGSIVATIMRDKVMVIPDGNSVINVGENVIVFALPQAVEKVERLFTAG